MTADQRLATYGSLGPGQPNHHQLSELRGQWSHGSVHGHLHDAGWGAAQGYLGLVLDPTGEAVAVELFSSDELPAHWPRLDAFEGEGYQRVTTEVLTSGGFVLASIYELATFASPTAASEALTSAFLKTLDPNDIE